MGRLIQWNMVSLDGYFEGVMPIVLGQGATLFGRGMDRMRMKLLDARPLSNGCVILRYEPQHRQ